MEAIVSHGLFHLANRLTLLFYSAVQVCMRSGGTSDVLLVRRLDGLALVDEADELPS